MKRQLRIAPVALVDLQAIWDFSAKNGSKEQSETYTRGLGKVFDLLCNHPFLARLRHELSPPMRLYRFQSHLAICTSDMESLTMLRVVHGRSNWAEYLAD